MRQNNMQDMVPPEKKNTANTESRGHKRKTIRDIPLPKTHQRKAHFNGSQSTTNNTSSLQGRQASPTKPPRRGMPLLGVWGVTIVSLVIVVFAVSTLFTSATVVVSPKQTAKNISLDLIAKKDAGDGIPFETISIQKKSSVVTEATTTATVEKRAQGLITVVNNFSEKPLNLVNKTRFQTKDGAIYRTEKPVTIPGKSESGPGRLAIRVVADEAGKEYNISKGTLTLPGLEGDPAYEDVYGEVTEPLTGGFSGEQYLIPEEKEQELMAKLKTEIKNSIMKDIGTETPDDYILYDQLISITYNEPVQSNLEGSKVSITLSGVGSTPIFPKQALTQHIIQNAGLDVAENEKVTIRNLSNLTFTPTGQYHEEQQRISGSIEGHAVFVWNVDEKKIRESVTGRDINKLGSILTSFTEIQEAKAHVQPSWVRTFPSDPDDISVETTAGKNIVSSDEN